MQAGTVASIMVQRLVPTLMCALLGTVALGLTMRYSMSWIVEVIGPATLCGLAPLAPTALQYAHTFRLNESIVAITRSTSLLLGFPLVSMVAASILVSQLGPPAAFASYAFPCSLLVSLSIVAFILPLTLRMSSGKREAAGAGTGSGQANVKMVYTGQGSAKSDAAGRTMEGGGQAMPPSALSASTQRTVGLVGRQAKHDHNLYIKARKFQVYRFKTARSRHPFNLARTSSCARCTML